MPVTVVQTSNAAEVAASLSAVPAAIEVALPTAVDTSATFFLAAVRRFASGRPGPNAPTGQYRASWAIERTGHAEDTVGTSAVQAHRLEYGYVGPDALGRRFHQPPFPHFDPAVQSTEPQLEAAVVAVVEAVL